MKGLLIIALALLIASLQCKLYQVVTFIAPGARYPINDLYDAKQYQKQWGEITSVGLRQQ